MSEEKKSMALWLAKMKETKLNPSEQDLIDIVVGAYKIGIQNGREEATRDEGTGENPREGQRTVPAV